MNVDFPAAAPHETADDDVIAPQTHASNTPLFQPDRLYRNYFSAVPDFCFDDRVADVFPDMIRRSVPGYGTVLELLRPVAWGTVRPGDRVYDLGCSVGAGLLAIQQGLHEQWRQQAHEHTPPAHQTGATELIGVDSSPAMLAKAQALIDAYTDNNANNTNASTGVGPRCHLSLRVDDITRMAFEPCRLIVLNYTLQFVPRPERDALIKRLYDALLPGGNLMLTEKLLYEQPDEAKRLQTLHESFKRSQGYCALEIARKREAIEQVLMRETENQHTQRLRQAGFNTIFTPLRCLEFTTFLAVKSCGKKSR